MKKVLLLMIGLFPVIGKAQSLFTVKGTGGLKNGDKIYLVYKTDAAVIMDSTVVAGHSFVFKGATTAIWPGYLCRNDNPNTAAVLYDAKNFYIEQGSILLNTRDSLKTAELSGTPTNDDLAELTAKLKPLQAEHEGVNNDFDVLTPAQAKDINVIAPIKARLKALLLKMAPIQFAFIKSHPQSYVSLATLQQTVPNADLLSENEAAFNALAPALRQTPLGIRLGKVIQAARKTANGSIAVDFMLADTNGRPVRLSDFKGKYVLVDFWASWCIPCREENPNIKLAYEKFGGRGFDVLGISLDERKGKNAWLKAIKSDGATWTQVLDNDDEAKKVKTLYGISTIPANVLIDPEGKIIARNLKDKVLLEKLGELLGSK